VVAIMSVRGKVWTVGLASTALLVGAVGWDLASRELSIPVALLGLALCALVAEGSALRSLARGRVRPIPPAGARMADGVVDIVPVAGVEGPVNPVNPRFRRFLRFAERDAARTSAPGLSATTPPLLGRAVLISVFVGRDGMAWTDYEIARCHDALERVGRWIEREASSRDALINIGLADTYFQVEDNDVDPVEIAFAPEGGDVGPMEANAATKAVVMASRAAAQLGFEDVVDLIGRINLRVEGDSRVWLLHVRRAGRSLAILADECAVSGVGLAVCFSREASFPEPLVGLGRTDPTTVAHEVLHLYGASDKYGVALRSYPTGSVTSRDIMRLNHDSLLRMTIDPLTASEIGWSDALSIRIVNKNARR
jgi:hypothetical protein